MGLEKNTLLKGGFVFVSSVPSPKIVESSQTEPDNSPEGRIKALTSVIEEYERRLAEKEREKATLLLTNEKLYQEKVEAEKLARVDSLTGLPNLRAYEERFEETINNAKRSGQPFCLLAIDIDDFKRLNDNEGHDAGNLALKTFARIVNENIRAGDIIARTGGEEFFLILPNTNIDESYVVANKLLKAFREQPGGMGHSPFTISGGIAQFDPSDKYLSNRLGLQEFADAGLYQAKSSGKNKVCSFNPEREIDKRAIMDQFKKLIRRNKPKELGLADQKLLFEEMASEIGKEIEANKPEAKAEG